MIPLLVVMAPTTERALKLLVPAQMTERALRAYSTQTVTLAPSKEGFVYSPVIPQEQLVLSTQRETHVLFRVEIVLTLPNLRVQMLLVALFPPV